MFKKFFRQLGSGISRGMGIDLGTANTLVHVQGRGIMLQEPSVVAIERDTNRLIEVGEEAKRMIGRTPDNVLAARPMKDGVIADFEQVEKMLRFFIEKVNRRKPMMHPQVVVGVPSGITEVERLAVIEAARKAGARDAYLLDEPMAAAIGAGLPWTEPVGSMIVDIGGGTTEVAVISFRGIVTSGSVRVAGDEIDEAIIEFVRRKYKLCIGYRTAEQAKIDIGSAYPLEEELSLQVRGRDLLTGLPKAITLTSKEVRDAIAEPVSGIVSLVKATLEATPPELASDILDQGITLAGGGALLRGLDRLIAEATGMPVRVAKDPLTCVVIGAGIFLEDLRVNAKLHNSSYNAMHVGDVV